MQTADENGPLSGSITAAGESSNGNRSQDGDSLQPTERDVDERPIGACYVEMTALMRAIDAVEAADTAAKNALRDYWACRDAAAMAAASSDVVSVDLMAQAWQIFDGRQELMQALRSHLRDLRIPK